MLVYHIGYGFAWVLIQGFLCSACPLSCVPERFGLVVLPHMSPSYEHVALIDRHNVNMHLRRNQSKMVFLLYPAFTSVETFDLVYDFWLDDSVSFPVRVRCMRKVSHSALFMTLSLLVSCHQG